MTADPVRHDLPAGVVEHVLAFADDEHLIGQQHTEWIGVAPFLEEDLAFCSIAQDELGHAASLYDVVGDPDRLAFGRTADAYRSCHLVELPCPDWAEALARHWLYDLAEVERWRNLADSSVPALRATVARAEREETYHRRHAGVLVERMLDAVGEASERLRAALQSLLPVADALWEPVAGEPDALADGAVAAPSAELRSRWRTSVDAVVGPVDWPGLDRPDQHARTRRSEHFAALRARITEVFDLDPTARW